MSVEKKDLIDGNPIMQIGIVIEDLEKAMKKYCQIFNVKKWNIYTFSSETLTEFEYKDEKVDDFEYKIALADIGNMQFELIQPVRNVPVFEEVLEAQGEGFHHIKQKVKTENIAQTVKEFKEKGIDKLGGGSYKDDIFVYLETESSLGIIWEIGNAADIGEPDKIFKFDEL